MRKYNIAINLKQKNDENLFLKRKLFCKVVEFIRPVCRTQQEHMKIYLQSLEVFSSPPHNIDVLSKCALIINLHNNTKTNQQSSWYLNK